MPAAILPPLASRLPAGPARRWLQWLSAGALEAVAARHVRSLAAPVPHRRPPMLQLKAPADQRSDAALRYPSWAEAYTPLVRHALASSATATMTNSRPISAGPARLRRAP